MASELSLLSVIVGCCDLATQKLLISVFAQPCIPGGGRQQNR